MPVCGPKLSLCCLLLSLWGIIQLAFMGIFFYIKSVALVEDLPLKETYISVAELLTDVDNAYAQNAYNCWIAACLYVGTLLISGHQYWANTKSSTSSF
jgi:ribonuclease kappa